MGVGTGLLAGAGSIAAPAASIVAGGLSQIYGPRVIFAVMAVMVVVAIVLLPTVKPPQAMMVPERPTAKPVPEPEPSGAETPPLPIPPIEPSGD
jgi:MFS family permease